MSKPYTDMRKVILSTNVSLDGFMSGPHGELDWHFRHWNDEMEDYQSEQLKSIDTILFGRVTYVAMTHYWSAKEFDVSGRKKDFAFAEWMMNTDKIVFSKTLTATEWNHSRIVSENIPEEINHLKQLDGKDMILWGGIRIAHTFLQMDLIDEYKIWIAPVVIGDGFPLFAFALNPFRAHSMSLSLVSTTTFSNGVILMSYHKI